MRGSRNRRHASSVLPGNMLADLVLDVGTQMLLDGEPHTLVGIAPAGFDFPVGSEVWAPLAFTPDRAADRGTRTLTVLGKLSAGASLADAQSELNIIARRLEQQYPDTNRERAERGIAELSAIADRERLDRYPFDPAAIGEWSFGAGTVPRRASSSPRRSPLHETRPDAGFSRSARRREPDTLAGMTVDELNACDRERFVAALGFVFEDSPWVAERAWDRRPFAGIEDLHAAMASVVDAAPAEEQLALLRAHPDLGTRARLSDVSAGEQASAGLDRLTPVEFERFQRLNGAYREKFGYPFLFAVRGRTKEQIIAALEARLPRSPEQELAEALRQVYRIAQFRLAETVR